MSPSIPTTQKDAGQQQQGQQQQGQQSPTQQQTGGQAPKPIFRDWAAL